MNTINDDSNKTRMCEHDAARVCNLFRCLKDCCRPKDPEYRPVEVPTLEKLKPQDCPFGSNPVGNLYKK
ncbi:hypothetical protein KY311_04765 [Candidatus Woesearchaeota archaeon]|nr:hypothetical protein [Candidatus Woesearchaeota archaeon]MBW3016961.1 hypothetical protein [Candidatus Woesearchaeota archaeon]